MSHIPSIFQEVAEASPGSQPRPAVRSWGWVQAHPHPPRRPRPCLVGSPDDSGPLFCLQHSSTLGGVFGDSFYEQQMAARQANALSHQVSGRTPQTLARPSHCPARPCVCTLPTAGEEGQAVDAGRDGQWLSPQGPGVGRARGFAGRLHWLCLDPGVEGAWAWEGWTATQSCSLTSPTIHPSISTHSDGAVRWPAQAGAETGRPRGRGTHAWQPQAWECRASQRAGGAGGRRQAGQQPMGRVPGRPAWGEPAHTHMLPLQLEQFNMMENAISSSSLYSPGSTLNYSQAAMMGLTGSHGNLQDTQQLGYPSHSSIPNIILTGEAAVRACSVRVSASVSPREPRGRWNPCLGADPRRPEPPA